MSFALAQVLWESCAVEPVHDAALESYARRKQGISLPATRYFAPVPWLARAVVDLRPEYGLLVHADQQIADLVTLIVSQESSCRYCYAAVRMVLWARGVDKARLEKMEEQLSRAGSSGPTQAAIAFGRAMARSAPSAARVARDMLRAEGFAEDEIREIAYVVAETCFSNRAHTIPAIPVRYLEDLPDRWYMRLARPLVNRTILATRHRGRRVPPIEGAPAYPYAAVIAAYAGSPIASALRHALDEMWASPHLTRRCKLLMLTVVARGLGCEDSVRELVQALEGEGLDRNALVDIVTHLDAAALDDRERLLVSFARETIWYEPSVVQRRARELRRTLSGPQLLEAVGVAALGNGLCRLNAAVTSSSWRGH